METDIVIIKNAHWPIAKVEARKGNYSDIEDNPSIGNMVLQIGKEWVIQSDGENVYYRRIDPPGDNVWIDRPCYGNGKTYTEII